MKHLGWAVYLTARFHRDLYGNTRGAYFAHHGPRVWYDYWYVTDGYPHNACEF